MEAALPACHAFIVELYGLDEKVEAEPASGGPPITSAEFFDRLYKAGTGQLGWTPAATLDASPTEIIEAARGRREMFVDLISAVLGKREDEAEGAPAPSRPEVPPTAAQIRNQLGALAGMGRVA